VTGLRFKIFLAMGALVVAAVGLLGFLSRGVTRTGVHQIVEMEEARGRKVDLTLAETLRRDLERAWARDGDFRASGELLAGFEEATGGALGMALFDDRPELVAGFGMPSSRVEARSVEEVEGRSVAGMVEARWAVDDGGRLAEVVLRGGLPVRAPDGRQVASLMPIPRSSPDRAAGRREALVRIDRRLLGAAVGAGALALLLGGLLARRIVRPVEALADAARDLGAGDLSRRVEVASEDELGRLARAFNDMAAALERAEALRRRMVADVAHELRTPLAALRAQLEAIEDGLAEASPEAVASLVEDTVHLAGLVDDLQDLALAEAGRLALTRRALDLEEEIRAAARSLGLESGPCLRLEVDGELPAVEADPRRLRQIFHNLLENARTHGASGTPERPIHVAVRSTEERPAMVEVTLRDHGPGIPDDEPSRIFERFHRGDPARARRAGGGGGGLGLAIVKALVELHGGSVGAENSPGGGAAVIVTLPTSGSVPLR